MRIPAFIIRCSIAAVWMIFVVLALHAFVDNVTYPQWSFASEFYFGLAAILVFSSVYLIAL